MLAEGLSDNLDSAILQIDCLKPHKGVPVIDVSVSYWLKGKAFEGDGYALDLFNSSGSGRPASYDIGKGEVSTSDVSFSVFAGDPEPPEYRISIAQFYSNLSSDVPRSITTSFRSNDEDHVMTFPTSGLRDVLDQMERYCPQG